MSSPVALDDDHLPLTLYEKRRRARNITLIVIALGFAAAFTASAIREDPRWPELSFDCATRLSAAAAPLGVERTTVGLPVLNNDDNRYDCIWPVSASTDAFVQAEVTRYNASFLTNPDKVARQAVADDLIDSFHPIGPQTPDAAFGDQGAGSTARILLDQVHNLTIRVDYQPAKGSKPLSDSDARAAEQAVVDTMVRMQD